jgi:hypothetical protein
MQDIHIHVTHHNFPARSKYVSCFSCILCVWRCASSSDEVGALSRNSFFVINILIQDNKELTMLYQLMVVNIMQMLQ